MWYKYQSQEADNTFITSDSTSPYNSRSNRQWSATIARITTKTQTRTWTTKRSSESCAIRSFLRVTLTTGKVGCRTKPPYSSSSGRSSGSSSVNIKQGWVQTYSASSTTPTEGGINRIYAQGKSRIRLRFNLRKANFHAWDYFEMGFFLKQIFSNWVGLILHKGSKF